MDADQQAESKVCKQIEAVDRSEHGLVMNVGRLADLQPATVNINKSDVHFGDKFITQNVTTADDFRGRAGACRCRGSVLVCVCWAGVLAAALCALLLLLLLSNNHRLDIGLNAEWYLRRDDWQAMPPYAVHFMTLPLQYVIVGHSVTSMCRDRYTCIKTVMAIQQDHLRREFDDIGPNFLVGSGGYILEGRGANVLGAMTMGWNSKSVSVMFLGDYTKDETDIQQFENVQVLLDKLEESGVLVSDYKILGYCQVRALTFSPGKNVMAEMHRLRHWEPANATDCIEVGLYARLAAGARSTSRAERGACAGATGALLLCAALAGYFLTRPEQPPPDVAPAEWYLTRDMWLARAHDESRAAEPYPLRLVVVHHSVSNECRRFIACAAELRNLQGYFLDKFEYDIPYNFLIGNDGRVYEGRGWGVEGAHTKGYNRCTLGIGFIGDYRESTIKTKITPTQLNRTQMLLSMGVKLGYLDPHYVVVGGKDVQATASPGDILYASLETWPHYDAARYRGLNCDQIKEANLENDTTTEINIPTIL